MLDKLSLGKKILLGYGAIAFICIGGMLYISNTAKQLATINDRVIKLRTPTAQASLMMMNGMNHSLAALRGWIILGKDKFKTGRAAAWSEELKPSLATLEKYSVNWTDPENVKRLTVIREKMKDFERYQQEIEDVAQSPDNQPALKILFEEAAPQAAILITNITKMINIEATLEATPERKALLGMMADVRGSTGLALANIRAYLLSGDDKFRDKFEKFWQKNTKRFGDLTANSLLLTSEQRSAFDSFSTARKIFSPLPPKMFEIRGSKEWNLANAWLGTKAAPTAFAIKSALNGMMKSQQGLLKNDMDKVLGLEHSQATVQWTVIVVSILAALTLGLLATRSVTKPLNGIMNNLAAGSRQVSGSATQVSSSSQTLAQGATEQASSLEETAAALEEVSSMVSSNTDSAKEASNLSQTVEKLSEQGEVSMTAMSKAINDIKAAADETSEIIKIIDDIAFQTNLLALNAAVEAARAGDAGKGFAVVAEEVRNLAQRSAEAAQSTGEKIKRSKDLADNGVQVSEEVAKSLTEIRETSVKASRLGGEISAASGEQAVGIAEVNTSVAELDKVTQVNAASAEESAAASEELLALARSMEDVVLVLGTLMYGAGGKAHKIGDTNAHSERTSISGKAGRNGHSGHQHVNSAGTTPAAYAPIEDASDIPLDF